MVIVRPKSDVVAKHDHLMVYWIEILELLSILEVYNLIIDILHHRFRNNAARRVGEGSLQTPTNRSLLLLFILIAFLIKGTRYNCNLLIFLLTQVKEIYKPLFGRFSERSQQHKFFYILCIKWNISIRYNFFHQPVIFN